MILLELAKEKGLEPKRIASTSSAEYASACPACGGNDRFRLWPNQQAKNCVGKYWCRQCGKKGDTIQFCIDFLGLPFKDAVAKVGATIQRDDYRPAIERSFITPTLIPPPDKWSQRALDFVQWTSDQIWQFPDKVEWLKNRGISEEAITTYRIGYCDQDLWVNPCEFGIDHEKNLFLPEGVVIPSIEPSGRIVRLKIRRTKWQERDELPKYWAIRGSMNGLNIVGDVRKPVMAVVESELDAFTLNSTCSHLLFVVAVGSNTKNPDNVVDYWAKRRQLLICHDNDEGGLAMNEKWKKLYSHAQSWPVPFDMGKDIGEAIMNGLDLRNWINAIINEK